MDFFKAKSFAKINLSLNVIKKMPQNYHKIQSIISFINLYDLIYLKTVKTKKHKVSFNGKFSRGLKKNNSIIKLLNILDKKKLLNNKKFKIKITKNIPQKSGMGGGSMNASTILNTLIKKKIIKVNENQINSISNAISSDVILGIHSNKKIIKSEYSVVKKLTKLPYYVVLTKPNFGCSTKLIYTNYKFIKVRSEPAKNSLYTSKLKLPYQDNDLEGPAFKKYPKLGDLKLFISKLPKVYFARMTGSGSVIAAYFLSKNEAIIAKKLIKRKYKNYWCIISKTI